MMRQIDEKVMVSGQVAPDEVASLAKQGITVLVNNRPDGEDPAQPPGAELEAAATAAGIRYFSVPIIRGIGPADVEAMQQALDDAEGGKLLAFCRSGMRSALAIGLARRAQGDSADEVRRGLVEAGFDPSPIAHLL